MDDLVQLQTDANIAEEKTREFGSFFESRVKQSDRKERYQGGERVRSEAFGYHSSDGDAPKRSSGALLE